MFAYTYKCDQCRGSASAFIGAIGYYELGSGAQFPAHSSPAWCDTCETIVRAEDLIDPLLLQRELRRLSEEGPNDADVALAKEIGQSCEEYCAARIVTWTRYLNIFSTRVSPNRCVECGSANIHFLFAEDGMMPDAFHHPRCGGQMRLIESAHASPATYFVLDCEGLRAGD